MTRVVTQNATATWVAFFVLLFLFWPLCWLPFVMDSAKQTYHYCTECHNNLGGVAPFKDCCSSSK